MAIKADEERLTHRREANRRWSLKNPGYKRRGKWGNKDFLSIYHKEYYQKNRARVREQQRVARQNTLFTGRRLHTNVYKRPLLNYCEVCGRTNTHLAYHHWDDNDLDLGIWVCLPCHHMAEQIDRGLCDIYLDRKEKIICQYAPM